VFACIQRVQALGHVVDKRSDHEYYINIFLVQKVTMVGVCTGRAAGIFKPLIQVWRVDVTDIRDHYAGDFFHSSNQVAAPGTGADNSNINPVIRFPGF